MCPALRFEMRVNLRNFPLRRSKLIAQQPYGKTGCVASNHLPGSDEAERYSAVQERRPFNTQFNRRPDRNFMTGANQNAAAIHIHDPTVPFGGYSATHRSVGDPQDKRKSNSSAAVLHRSVGKCISLTIFYRTRRHSSEITDQESK